MNNACTPAEARLRWCPFVRLLAVAQPDNPSTGESGAMASYNRAIEKDQLPMLRPALCCIASQCMLWRWKVEGIGYCGMTPLPPVATNGAHLHGD